MNEEWRPIPGYEGLYEASSGGQIRSLDRVIVRSNGTLDPRRGRVLRPCIDKDGYLRVHLTCDRKKRPLLVHKLVTLAFLGPRPAALVTRHLNGVATDNRLENLRYGTQSENCYDRVAHGNDYNSIKTQCRYGHEYTGANLKILPNGGRDCRQCIRDRSNKYRLRRKVAS